MLERAPESIVWGGPILAPPAQGPCVTELTDRDLVALFHTRIMF